jgi:hypothetical protein
MGGLAPRGLLLALGDEIGLEAARLCFRLGNHGENLCGRRGDARVDVILDNRPGWAADGWGWAGGWALPGFVGT